MLADDIIAMAAGRMPHSGQAYASSLLSAMPSSAARFKNVPHILCRLTLKIISHAREEAPSHTTSFGIRCLLSHAISLADFRRLYTYDIISRVSLSAAAPAQAGAPFHDHYTAARIT